MKRMQKVAGVLCGAMLAIGTLAPAKAQDGVAQNEAIAEFRQLYEYSPFTSDFQPKGSLDYEGFSGQCALDRGLKKTHIYALYGNVKAQNLEDYLLYLERFGYSVENESFSASGRYIEVEGEHMTLCLPEYFMLDYYEAEGHLITNLPMGALSATAALVWNRAQTFRPELWQTKPLTDTLHARVTALYCTPACAITPQTQPYCALALPGQSEGMLNKPLPNETATGQTFAGVFHGQTDSRNQTAPLCLVRVTILNAGEPLAMSDLELCLGRNDLTVVYPLQMGTELHDVGQVPTLDTRLPATVGEEQSLWLLFPSVSAEQGAQYRLYVSLAQKHTPLLERVNFGLWMDAQP